MLQAYQERLADEVNLLCKRLDSLKKIAYSRNFKTQFGKGTTPICTRAILRKQYAAMKAYAKVLFERPDVRSLVAIGYIPIFWYEQYK